MRGDCHNALLGCDTASNVTFQAEFFPGGDFEYRYEDRTLRYRVVAAFDWDDDGLANEVGPEPYDNNGDFCGTCAGWYNANCSNVIVAVEGTNGVVEVSWLPDANPAAYYWLDVSVTGAVDVAGIRVTCDGPSNLGHLFVVARTNQTCHIPLLAGATYVVESTLPLCALAATSQQVAPDPYTGSTDCHGTCAIW